METLYDKALSWLEDNATNTCVLKEGRIIGATINDTPVCCYFSPDDDGYFSIHFQPISGKLFSDVDPKLLANRITHVHKCIKCYIENNGDIALTVEVLCCPDPDLDVIFPRSVTMLLFAAKNLLKAKDMKPFLQCLNSRRAG